MPSGSELSIVSGEPAAGTSHIGGSVMLSITFHAAAVVVAAGTGWWMDNRVHVPLGHASHTSASAIQLTASVLHANQLTAVLAIQQATSDESGAEVESALADATDSPVDDRIWDQPDRPLQDLAAAAVREALRKDHSTPASAEQPAKSETNPSTKLESANKSEHDLPARPHETSQAESDAATSPASAESQAAIASQTIGAQVDVTAKPLPNNPPPRFPAAAMREGRGGRVVLKVTVNSKGTVTRLSVLKTSGHADLDQAAIDGVGRWSFEPARRLGLPVTQDIAVPISFEFE